LKIEDECFRLFFATNEHKFFTTNSTKEKKEVMKKIPHPPAPSPKERGSNFPLPFGEGAGGREVGRGSAAAKKFNCVTPKIPDFNKMVVLFVVKFVSIRG
jgi:hypothetical protein